MISCAGDVELYEDEDFTKYELRLKVKFRDDEELTQLTKFHQSGGERAVTTIIYLLALQELTPVPFRVVDEINQGMDASNERKIFDRMVRASQKENAPQVFLLTPKVR